MTMTQNIFDVQLTHPIVQQSGITMTIIRLAKLTQFLRPTRAVYVIQG